MAIKDDKAPWVEADESPFDDDEPVWTLSWRLGDDVQSIHVQHPWVTSADDAMEAFKWRIRASVPLPAFSGEGK